MMWRKTIAIFWLLIWAAGTAGASLGPTLHGIGHDCECRAWICLCLHDKPGRTSHTDDRQIAAHAAHSVHAEAVEVAGPMCHKPNQDNEQPCTMSKCGGQQADDGLLTAIPAILPWPEAMPGPGPSGLAQVAGCPDFLSAELLRNSPPPRPLPY
jgi:hypothetical protein